MQPDPIRAAANLFIRRWGEMGASWGISRTMAELHALLYLAPEPLCTDDVMEQLSISRGSASMNLRELVNWGLIDRVHRRGDRKEYFQAQKDVWQMFETIVRERRRREVLPIVETIERCMAMLSEAHAGNGGADADAHEGLKQRLSEILEFCEVINKLFHLMTTLGPGRIRQLLKQLEVPLT
ncbi:MAG: transcriptional regulator [Phycisphaerae bacterium]|nr:transcriptional regulator [Phycisphaerae bacterium]